MSILLTGGAGYIGSHTAVACIDARYDIVIADNFSNSDPSVIDRLQAITKEKIPCYPIDVSDSQALNTLFSENYLDAVIQFAGYKAVGESVEKPVQYYRNNLDTTLTLLEAMKEHDCHRIVFSSSATVYGEHNTPPYTENMPTGN